MPPNRLKPRERRELVKALVLGGIPDQDIVDDFGRGFTITDGEHRGKLAKATPRAIRGDLEAIADEYRERAEARHATEIGAGTAMERLARVAVDAQDAERYGEAIRANVELLDHLAERRQLHRSAGDHVDAKISRALRRRHDQKPTKRGRGRPTKLTRKIIERVATGIRLEMTHKAAAVRARISEASFYAYLERGRLDAAAGEDSIYVEFLEAIERAEADAQASALATIWDAINDGTWQAAFRMLESRYPERFARRSPVAVQQTVQVAGQGPQVVQVNLRELEGFTPEQLRALAYDDDQDNDTED